MAVVNITFGSSEEVMAISSSVRSLIILAIITILPEMAE